MPDIFAIQRALGEALADIPSIGPIAWPNRTADPARPFVIFDHVPGPWALSCVDGTNVRAEGYFVASVCIAQGGFSSDADMRANAIIAAFPPGLRLGGVCVQQARPLPGYFDGIGWRQPVRVDYRSET